MSELDQFWGTTITDTSFNIVDQTLTISIVIFAGSNPDSYHKVSFERVDDWKFFSNFDEPWDYVELTQVEVVRSPVGLVTEIMIWSEEAGITVKCESIKLDGVELEV